jgi:hypothetical protein
VRAGDSRTLVITGEPGVGKTALRVRGRGCAGCPLPACGGDISRPESLERADAPAFNQWRVADEHRPLGEMMLVRRINSASAKIRRELNHQPQTEPAGADEVLP